MNREVCAVGLQLARLLPSSVTERHALLAAVPLDVTTRIAAVLRPSTLAVRERVDFAALGSQDVG